MFAIVHFMFVIDHCILAIERLICNAFMFLRIFTTFGPNMKRHICLFMCRDVGKCDVRVVMRECDDAVVVAHVCVDHSMGI